MLWPDWTRVNPAVFGPVAFGTDVAHPITGGVLDAAPTPAVGRTLSQAKLAAILRRAGRQRNVER
jgi:hypothetical protein